MSEATIQALKNGPLILKGPAQLTDAEGKPIAYDGQQVSLCRCGHSAKKPFCDGAHRKIGFEG